MKTSWDLKYLQGKKKYYSRLLKETDDEELKEKLDITIGSIEEIIDYIKPPLLSGKDDFRSIILDDKLFLSYHKSYIPYINILASYEDKLDVDYDGELTRINTTPSKILTVTSDFYNQLKSRLLVKRFNDLYQNRDRLLRFRKIKDVSQTADAGITFPIYSTKEILMSMYYDNTLQDYVTAIHEYGHGISSLINPNMVYDTGNFVTAEIPSLFLEMIGTDYINQNDEYKTDVVKVNADRFADYLECSIFIGIKSRILGFYEKNKKLSKKNITDYLKNIEFLGKDEIDRILYIPASYYFQYTFSYLVAIELYMMYRNDQKRALNCLKEIISLDNLPLDSYLDELHSRGIFPGNSLSIYLDELNQSIKELRDGKSL